MRAPREGEELRVAGTEAVGPYTLLRVEAGSIDPGVPGQFFMLHPPGHVLPRPMSLCLTRRGRAVLPDRPDRPRHAHALRARRGGSLHVLGPLGNGFDLDGAAPADRRRWHRRGAVPVRRPGARRGARDPRLPHATPRRGGRARPGSRGRRRAHLRHVAAARGAGRRARVRAGADARGRARARAAGPARVGGPDGLRIRSLLRLRGRGRRAACSGSASRGRCSEAA